MTALLNRRTLLRTLVASAAGYSASGWFPLFARELAANPKRRRHCVLLWMSGGPSQTDTFDLKPDHENGGEFKEIETKARGLRFSEHLPKLAAYADRLAVIRGLNTKEGDHGRGTYLMRTGRKPLGPIQYPSIGSALASQLGGGPAGLPGYISVGPYRAFNQEAFGPGFLGPRFGPLIVGAADVPGSMAPGANGYPQLRVKDLEPRAGIAANRVQKRLALWQGLESEFVAAHQAGAPMTHRMVYENAVGLMHSEDATAFDLDSEPDEVRDAYGKSAFGQGCLLARRLIERGVPFIEVSLGTTSGGAGWDTHADNFNQLKQLSGDLDAGWAALMKELAERGLLDSTTILWMGEFGRTPKINGNQGRDHFPNAWSCVLAGGGVAGGQAFGRTSEDGMTVADGQVGAADVLATLCEALGVPADASQMSNLGRPISITDGTPIKAILA
ncbi:MAG TPA: DUF1501 domain-containing protein [Pirellulales bacterium]|nr:DUF1501 domain-containing protein [Pirellulales bacterium]